MPRLAADATVFHAIADPTRRAILDILREGERTVSEMFERIKDGLMGGVARITQPAFSQHLSVLKKAGLVTARRVGRTRVYAFTPEPLTDVVDWIVAYDRFWTEKLENLGKYLDNKYPDKAHGTGGRGGGS